MKAEDYLKLNDCYRTEMIPGKDLAAYQYAETGEDFLCNCSEVKNARVARCPIGQEYCDLSCYFRKGNQCCFKSECGRQMPELKKGRR